MSKSWIKMVNNEINLPFLLLPAHSHFNNLGTNIDQDDLIFKLTCKKQLSNF